MGLRKTTVLVVDDDKGFCTFLSTLLETAGIEALVATAVDEAIATARARCPDAAIIDVVLPGQGGYSLCRELRDEHGDDLPVMFVSGVRTDPIDRTAGILVGGDDYLTKPVDPEELLARLWRLLERSRRYARATQMDLSEREIEVLQLVAEGWPPAEVAGRLFISPKTVCSHMQRIFVKLDVHTRAQAVAIAYEAGLVRVNPSRNDDNIHAQVG
jgi:DNA-binding NarL/FixJ family response regulator